MDSFEVLRNQDIVLRITFLILLIMSIISWATFLYKFIISIIEAKENKNFISSFKDNYSINSLASITNKHSGYLRNITFNSLEELSHYQEQKNNNLSYENIVNRSVKSAFLKEISRFGSGLIILASIGATAPFIGLFGTVWGMYHALRTISLNKQVSLALVAGPIGECLIATAFGLFVAIPAVLFYNFLSNSNKSRIRKTSNFTYDLETRLLNIKE